MPQYDLRCPQCENTQTVFCKMSEFDEEKKKWVCVGHGEPVQMEVVFHPIVKHSSWQSYI